MGRKEASASMEIRSGKASYGIMVYGDCFIARVRCDSCNREVLCMDGNVAGYDPTDAAIRAMASICAEPERHRVNYIIENRETSWPGTFGNASRKTDTRTRGESTEWRSDITY